MIGNNFTYVAIVLSFLLIVSAWKYPGGALALNCTATPHALLKSPSQDFRDSSVEASSHASFLIGKHWLRAAQVEDTSWPVLALEWRTILAAVLGMLAATLSSASGIGGGALFVPIFNLLLGFDSNTSAALSSCMIFGGTVVTLLWYVNQKHPLASDKPLVDYDVALVFQPNVLLGISIGVLCNVMSPSWLITAALIVFLSLMTVRSCGGAIRLWNAESCSERDYVDIPVVDGKLSDGLARPIPCSDRKEEANDEAQYPLLDSRRQTHPQFPAAKVAMLALIWVGFFAVQLVHGIASAEGLWDIDECGISYWLVTLSQVPLAVIVTALIVAYFRTSAKPLEDCNIVNSRSLRALPVLALLAGLLGGMLGLGGGMIISPLLMEIDMHPQVTAATCTFMVFFSSSLSVVQYCFLGKIPLAWGISSAIVALVFSIVGVQGVQKVIRKYRRVSVIRFAYSIVIGVSAILMAVFGSLDVWSDIQLGAYMGFTMPC